MQMHQPTWPPAALLAFLHARLDEVERVARAAATGPWSVSARGRWQPSDEEAGATVDDAHGNAVIPPDVDYGPVVNRADAEHIALHDPARELREVEAKRLRLRFIELSDDLDCADYLARIEALAFADHSGYREEWRP